MNIIRPNGESSVKIPNGNGYEKLKNVTAYTSLTQILSVTGSGFLKSAFNINASSPATDYYSQIVIAIDGTAILNINNTATKLNSAGAAHGITDNIMIGTNYYPIMPMTPFTQYTSFQSSYADRMHNFTFPSTSEQTADTIGCLFVIPELVRFEKSLTVSVKKENAGVVTGIEYYLDD